ncbi:hypothetical protein AB0N17_44905 [Streptomyces sp. NPDC051133]|uniref:hypothetical protein n=1 Tax=Streptomyces sp. NPDC051133 TaxID=3155521 RepID=UPI003433A0A0
MTLHPRWRNSGIAAATALSFLLIGTTSAHAAHQPPNHCDPAACVNHLTPLDSIFLNMPGHSYGTRDRATGAPVNSLNDWASAYCAKAGFGGGRGQCSLNSFSEESFFNQTPHYKKRASGLLFNCTKKPASQSLGWAYTREASVTYGYSSSVAVGKGLSIGYMTNSAFAFTLLSKQWSTQWSWGLSSTQSGNTKLSVAPGEAGWFSEGDFYGTAHGLAFVTISSPDDAYQAPGKPVFSGSYTVVTDIRGVMPQQTDHRAVARQGAVGLLAESRPMTASEKASCAGRRSAFTKDAPITASSTESQAVTPQ